MSNVVRVGLCLVALLSTAASAQTAAPAPQLGVRMNVYVESKDGSPVPALDQSDFKLMDNGVERPIGAFRATSSLREPVHVLIVMDDINVRLGTMTYEQQEVVKFLEANGGKLAHPTAVTVLTSAGFRMPDRFTNDGTALGTALAATKIGVREVTRSAGSNGDTQRMKNSLDALRQMEAQFYPMPGRKVILWVSPGWRVFDSTRNPMDTYHRKEILADVVAQSNILRQANMTLYQINPVGPTEDMLNIVYYKEYVKGLDVVDHAEVGDLYLQVLALQSGGLVLDANSDISAMLHRSLADSESWYEIAFLVPPATRADEYHHLEIKIDKPGVTARTRDGYYNRALGK